MIKKLMVILIILFFIESAQGQLASIRFILNDTFESVKINFKDSALKALQIESEILSSQEFKDSLVKYTFDCRNKPKIQCNCNDENNTCNSGDRISGLTIYNNLMKDSIVTIKLIVARASFRQRYFSKSYGSSCPCDNVTRTYTWWLSDDIIPLTYNYAAHLAHEYSHIVGYVHGEQPLYDDAAYTVGNIVVKILKRRLGVS